MCIIERIETAINTHNTELLEELLKEWDSGKNN